MTEKILTLIGALVECASMPAEEQKEALTSIHEALGEMLTDESEEEEDSPTPPEE